MSKALVAFAESAGRYRDALRAALPEEPTPEMIDAMVLAQSRGFRSYVEARAAYRALRAELLGEAG